MIILNRALKVEINNWGGCNLEIPPYGDRPGYSIWMAVGGGWRWMRRDTGENSEKVFDAPSQALWDLMKWPEAISHQDCIDAGLICD